GRTLVDPRWLAIRKDGSDFPPEEYATAVTLRTGHPQKGVIMGVHKPDGSLTWISTNTQPLFQNDPSHASAVVATFTDITREHNLLEDEKRHTRQMRLLNEIINTALETSDFEQMLQIFADRLGDLLTADGAYVSIWDAANRRILSAAVYGDLLNMQPIPDLQPGEMTLTEAVLQAERVLVIEDTLNTPHLSPRLASSIPARSVLALPLIVRDLKLGAVLIAFNQPHIYSAQEIFICEQAARQVALAVSKAQVFEAERRRASQLSLLEEASRRIEGALDQQAICQRTVEILVKRFGYAEAAIMLSTENNELKLIAINGTETLRLRPGFVQKMDEGIIGHVATIRDVYIAKDLAYDPYYFHPTKPRSGSAISLPMLHEDQLLGVLYVESQVTNHFDADDIQTLQTLTAHVTTGVQKARLYEAERRRALQLTLLEEASRQIAGLLDEREICQHVVQTVVRSFGYAEASILMAVEKDELELIAISGTEDMGFRAGFRAKVGRGIVGHVALTQETYITSDISRDAYYATPPAGPRTGSAMCMPMLYEDELLGVLYIESVILNDFDTDIAHTFQTLTSHTVTAIQRARLFGISHHRLKAITAVQSVSQTVASSLELEQIFQTVVDMLKNTFGYTFVSIYLLEGEVLQLGAQIGYPLAMVYTEIPVAFGIAGRAVQSRQIQFIPDVRNEPGFLRASLEVESEICVPLLKEGGVLGVLNVESQQGRPLTQEDVELLASLAGPIAVSIDNARLHSNVKSLALTDSLTTLANRRAFDYALESEVARVMRYGPPLSLIILDIDSFKVYNDTWGHLAGDGRLRAVADLLRANVRHPDIAARYGGEEFALLLPFTDKAGALLLAERLRFAAQAIAPHAPQNGTAIAGYTLSLGVASFPEDGETAEEILLAADNAELAAKRLGKNRVYAANSSHKLPNA
ncbi:MAG TPA: GAF domain-containing protein, partial [Anaerolineales bacterium]|nr:GAF domain-containing protein [Anaerolineales bacterium]